MAKKAKRDWSQKLSPVAKAEILAATFHQLTSHMPKIWEKVPTWLQDQIKQAMYDCSIDNDQFSKKDIRLCIEYGKFLSRMFPCPRITYAKTDKIPKDHAPPLQPRTAK